MQVQLWSKYIATLQKIILHISNNEEKVELHKKVWFTDFWKKYT